MTMMQFGAVTSAQFDRLLSDPEDVHWCGTISTRDAEGTWHQKDGLYWTPARIRPDVEMPASGKGIGRQAVLDLPAVWAEADHGTIPEQLERLDRAIAHGMPAPTAVVLSGDDRPQGASPGRSIHCFWRLQANPWTMAEEAQWRNVMAAVCHAIEGDATAINPSRRMRVGGAHHGSRYQTVIRTHTRTDRTALEAWAAGIDIPAPMRNAASRIQMRKLCDFAEINLPDYGITLAELAETVEDKLSICCPFHDDGTPSAFIGRRSDGRAFVSCSTCKTSWTDNPALAFALTQSGTPKTNLTNTTRALRRDSRYAGRLRYDEFLRQITLGGKPIKDHDLLALRIAIHDTYGFEPFATHAAEATTMVAHENPTNQVQEYLADLEWDRQPRLDGWLIRAAGIPDTPLHRAYGAKTAIAAVARALTPGCQVDTVLLLVGKQGTRKSSMYRALFSDRWFLDEELDLSNPVAAAMQLATTWGFEVGEMNSFARADRNRAKAFITRRTDAYRPPYGRTVEEYPRHSILVGSSNDEYPLTDPTGDRRFWAVRVNEERIDTDWVEALRDQLWAEAAHRFKAKEPWHLDDALDVEREISNDEFRAEDTNDAMLLRWLRDYPQPTFGLSAAIIGALRVPRSDIRRHSTGVSEALRRLGCERVRQESIGGKRERLWRKPRPGTT